MNKALREAIDILKAVASPPTNPGDFTQPGELDTKKAAECPGEDSYDEDVEKALKAAAAASMAKRARLHDHAAGVAANQPTIGTNRTRGPGEPPVVPIRHVEQPFAMEPAVIPDMLKSCNQCGSTHKSLVVCPRCDHNAKTGGEAGPLHFRGR